MNKKLFLLVLPALMLISSCGNSSSGMSRATKFFVDDCLAHEEIFGEAGELIPFKSEVKRTAPAAPELHATIGYQRKYDSSADEYSVRFVAKVANPGSIESATRTRNVCDHVHGDAIGSQKTKSPTGYYEIINDNKTPTSAGEGYGFIVYTVTNIPAANVNDYISVYLTLSNGIESSYSDTYVVSAGSDDKLSFEHGVTDFTCLKKHELTTQKIDCDNPIKGSDPTDFASFTLEDLDADDTVSIFGHDGINNRFAIISTHSFTGENNVNSGYCFEDEDGKIKAKYAADYTLYLNSSCQLYTDFENIVRPMYVKVNFADWLGDNADIWIYAWKDDGSSKWYQTDSLGNSLFATHEMFDRVSYDKFMAVRYNPAKNPTTEQNPWAEGCKRNQTNDLNAPARNVRDDCIFVTNWNVGSVGTR